MQGTTQKLQQDSDKQTVSVDEIETVNKCGECSGDLVQANTKQEKHCEDCGLVIESHKVDRGPEWRAYNQQEKNSKSRVGSPETKLLHDKGLTTNISWSNKDGYGRQLSEEQKQHMQRLRKWNKRVRYDSSTESLHLGLGEIRRMGSALGVPKQSKETAAMVFQQAQDADVLLGRSVESVSSAALLIALRTHNTPRSVNEIAVVSRAERTAIMRAKREIAQQLGLETTITSPLDYLPRYASKLNIPHDLEKEAEQLLKDVEGSTFLGSGRQPDILAACAIYAASITSDNLLTQKEISDEVNITPVSIRSHYKKFLTMSERYDITEEHIEENMTPKDILDHLSDS